MATNVTLTLNKASTNYTLSTGARGPAPDLSNYARTDIDIAFTGTVGFQNGITDGTGDGLQAQIPAGGGMLATTSQLHNAVTVSGTEITLSGQQLSANIGTAAGTIAAGNDSRIVNAVQPADISLMVESDVTGITDATAITNIVGVEESNYPATPDANTLYVILPDPAP
jgi:hypothetical protein